MIMMNSIFYSAHFFVLISFCSSIKQFQVDDNDDEEIKYKAKFFLIIIGYF